MVNNSETRSDIGVGRGREMARAGRCAAAGVGEEAFDDSVFERMEGDDDEATIGFETAFGGGECVDELAELVVDVDAQRLKRPRRGVFIVAFGAAKRALDETGELAGRGDRRIGADSADGAGDGTRSAFLAEIAPPGAL